MRPDESRIRSRYGGRCRLCLRLFASGDWVLWKKGDGIRCVDEEPCFRREFDRRGWNEPGNKEEAA
jgi:hypothetical protein